MTKTNLQKLSFAMDYETNYEFINIHIKTMENKDD